MATGGTAAEPAGEVMATAAELADVLKLLTGQLNALRASGRRRTWGVIAVAVSVALDIALSIVVALLVIGLINAQVSIRAAQLQACQAGNSFRTGQLRLWDHVLQVSQPPPGETAAERRTRLAALAAFRVYVDRQFLPVNCTRELANGERP